MAKKNDLYDVIVIGAGHAGTEAAAATAITMETTSAEVEEPLEFYVNQPFIYAIVDQETGKAVGQASYLRISPQAGSIEVGKQADFVILDRNLFEVRPDEIDSVKVSLTMLDGEAVYRAGEAK